MLTLNIIPILVSIGLILLFIKCYSFGLLPTQIIKIYEAVKFGFRFHFTLFACISPFFLALIIGDSFCTEFNKGYMKMLLLTPVRRIDIILAKSFAILSFLIIATIFGGILLQGDMILTNLILNKIPSQAASTFSLITVSSALQLLFIAIIGNLTIAGFLVLISMFFESATVMAVCSSFILMIIYAFHAASPLTKQFYDWVIYIENINFIRHLNEIYSPTTINNICNGTLSALSGDIFLNSIYSLVWSIIFFASAAFIFSRKHILH